MSKSYASELREEWSEPVDECIALLSKIDRIRLLWVRSILLEANFSVLTSYLA